MDHLDRNVYAVIKSRDAVWRFRDEWSEMFPTPTRVDSAAFDVTEVGEALQEDLIQWAIQTTGNRIMTAQASLVSATKAIDAGLRMNGDYVRNNDRALKKKEECCDAGMMAITMLGKGFCMDEMLDRQTHIDLATGDPKLMVSIASDIFNMWQMESLGNDRGLADIYAKSALLGLAQYLGPDEMIAGIQKRVDRIKAKLIASRS